MLEVDMWLEDAFGGYPNKMTCLKESPRARRRLFLRDPHLSSSGTCPHSHPLFAHSGGDGNID
jgi:hypothetical protein